MASPFTWSLGFSLKEVFSIESWNSLLTLDFRRLRSWWNINNEMGMRHFMDKPSFSFMQFNPKKNETMEIIVAIGMS